MSTNIKIMRFLALIAILSLIISYLVHLNMEMRFCVLNSLWISNNFLFTIFCGAFASVLIALLMEARQYTLNKVVAENQIFCDVTILFGQISIIKYTLLRIKEQPNEIISPEALTMPIQQCEQIINSLHNIDYHPLFKSNKLTENLEETNGIIAKSIAPFLFHAKFLQCAIHEDKILELQQTGKSINPTYSSYYCKLTIDKLFEDITPIANDLAACTQKIAKAVNLQDRFNQIYKDFTQYEENYEAPSLKKYLGI